MNEIRWLAGHEVHGAVVFRVGVMGAETLIAEWMGEARLTCNRAGDNPHIAYEPHVSSMAKQKIENASRMLLRQVARGFAFHGSCVVIAGRALLMTGRSGVGKSTLAAWLVAHGASIISDDLTPVDATIDGGWIARPFESTSWLDGAASAFVAGEVQGGERKMPVTAARVAKTTAPLAGILDLAFDEQRVTPRLVPIGGIDAIGSLFSQTVRFVIDEPERHQRELDSLVALTNGVPVRRLERRRSFDDLHAVRELIESWMKALPSGSHEQGIAR